MIGFAVAGACFMLAAAISDPRAESDLAAAGFLLGAALLVIGFAA